jgi:hypothetical protein
LQWLPVENEYLETLHPITDNNLKVFGDLMDERRFRQRSDTLLWFWRIGLIDDDGCPCMEECMYSLSLWNYLTNMLPVYRVCGLRGKAQFSRWSEELRLVGYEMQWSVKWFQWQEDKWRH